MSVVTLEQLGQLGKEIPSSPVLSHLQLHLTPVEAFLLHTSLIIYRRAQLDFETGWHRFGV